MTDDILPKHIKDRVIAELDKIDGVSAASFASARTLTN